MLSLYHHPLEYLGKQICQTIERIIAEKDNAILLDNDPALQQGDSDDFDCYQYAESMLNRQ